MSGVGSTMYGCEHRRQLVSKGSRLSYQLPGITGCFSSPQNLCEQTEWLDSSENGQHLSINIHKSEGRDTLHKLSNLALEIWEWRLLVFQQIQQSLGSLQIDLFASCLTKQLPRYYSWRPDSEVEATDAFTQNWAQAKGFANPLWCLIPWCLSQIRR